METSYQQVYSKSTTYTNINGKEKRFDVMHYKDPEKQKDAYYAGLRDPDQNKFEEELGKSKNRSAFSVLKRRDGQRVGLLRRPFEEMKRYHDKLTKKYIAQPHKLTSTLKSRHPKMLLDAMTPKEMEINKEFLKMKQRKEVAKKRNVEALLSKISPFDESFFEETQV